VDRLRYGAAQDGTRRRRGRALRLPRPRGCAAGASRLKDGTWRHRPRPELWAASGEWAGRRSWPAPSPGIREAWFPLGGQAGGGPAAMADALAGGPSPSGSAGRRAARIWRTASESSTVAITRDGSARILVNSAADWGVSDPLKVPKDGRPHARERDRGGRRPAPCSSTTCSGAEPPGPGSEPEVRRASGEYFWGGTAPTGPGRPGGTSDHGVRLPGVRARASRRSWAVSHLAHCFPGVTLAHVGG